MYKIRNMQLNLDPFFKPVAGEEISFEAFTFSGGEPHIRINSFDSEARILVTHRLRSFNDLGLLLVAIDSLKRMGHRSIEVFIPYFPAARQDRVMNEGESLSVKVYADIINAMNLEKVTVFDPHSDVTAALLENCSVISNHGFVKKVMKELPNDCILVSPDAGAEKKIHQLASYLEEYEVLSCGKKRDIKTGSLSGFVVPDQDLKNRPCLIVDDICDGGGTFIGLAKKLKLANAGKLYLAVSHGIFSKGLDILNEHFERVFTTDSFRDFEMNEVSQISISDFI